MFTLIEDRQEIAKAQGEAEVSLRKMLTTKRRRSIGYPSNTEHGAEIHTDGRYWHRTADYKVAGAANPRRLNWFGLYREDLDLEITVEVNVPYSGSNGSVAGFFARDSESKTVYMMHSGRVGGGKKELVRTRFFRGLGSHSRNRLILAVGLG